jgi:hypothetical protein
VPAPAQDKYPSRAVEIVVPFAAGGGTDVLARMLADGLARRLGQSFVVINRPGANTNLGTQLVVKSKPDGHTLVMGSLGLAANPSLYRKLPFRPLEDLAPISLLANAPTILVVHPSFPANDLKSFIAHVKAQPGKLNYASYGAGSGPHLATELFKSMTATDIVHVPFGGGGPAAVAVTGNQVEMLFASVLPVLALVRSKNLKPIAIAAGTRSPLLPEPELDALRAAPLEVTSGEPFAASAYDCLLPPAARRLTLALVDVGGVERIVVERALPADPRTAPRLLVDGSMIELFDGGPTAFTTRAYPTTASRWVLHLDSPAPIRAWQLGLD